MNNIEEKALDKLKIAMNRSDTEKFYTLTSLIKVNNLMKKAKIVHKS